MGRSIGIDFGTTNTVVCYTNRNGRMVSFSYDDTESGNMIPSAVFFETENQWIIGEKAVENLKLNPSAGVINFKSRIGSKELYGIIPNEENRQKFFASAKQITGWFLKKVLQDVQKKLEEEFEDDYEIETVAVSVPAKFNCIEREEIKQAVMDAASVSIEHVKIVIESTAAAFAHVSGMERKPENVLVYDFGGGTFDVTLLLITEEGIYKEAVVPGGDKKLGGSQLTTDIMKYFSKYLNEHELVDIPIYDGDEESCWGDCQDEEEYRADKHAIYRQAELIKRLASREDNGKKICSMELEINGIKNIYDIEMDKDTVVGLIKEKIDRTIVITGQILDEARRLGIMDIDSVVLAGGSSQILMVREKLEKELGLKFQKTDNIETMIARGAALFAEGMDNRRLWMQAKTNTQIGIASRIGSLPDAFDPVIDVNMNLPYENTKTFQMNADYAQKLSIQIFERDIMNESAEERMRIKRVGSRSISWLGELVIRGLPRMRREEAQIDVIISVQTDGIWNIKVLVRNAEGEVIDSSSIQFGWNGNFR